ncbi:Os07g0632901 [Oryza sativa Japonica Group]|uniref:Os07g0632901 protein n=1 Tax=Oryza sativa subsp. japonica TaxID=39947 RepID=A0A0P0X989_ORYSJ|nr:Os07g0632901 [Oryza sativa Japonica Group]
MHYRGGILHVLVYPRPRRAYGPRCQPPLYLLLPFAPKVPMRRHGSELAPSTTELSAHGASLCSSMTHPATSFITPLNHSNDNGSRVTQENCAQLVLYALFLLLLLVDTLKLLATTDDARQEREERREVASDRGGSRGIPQRWKRWRLWRKAVDEAEEVQPAAATPVEEEEKDEDSTATSAASAPDTSEEPEEEEEAPTSRRRK